MTGIRELFRNTLHRLWMDDRANIGLVLDINLI